MASVVISLDAEVATESRPDAQQRAREGWLTLVDCFERYEIPATWAIVGRLFTDDDRLDGPPPEQWFTTPSETRDATDAETEIEAMGRTNRTVDGRSLVEAVVESGVNHDIGSHSYSHPRFTEMTREFAHADLTAARAAMAEWGIDPGSFVYPYNAAAHHDVLADVGFTCYRGVPEDGADTAVSKAPSARTWQRTVLDLVPEAPKWWAGWAYDRGSEALAYTLGNEPPALIEPCVDDHGMIAIPQSMPPLYRMPVWLRRALRSVGQYPLARIAKMGIDAAIEKDGTFHLWFHPGDLYTESDFESFAMVLAYLADRRDDGVVEVETMADIAARLGRCRSR